MAETPAERIKLQIEIEFRRSYARHAEKGVLRNISLTGAFIRFEGNEEHGFRPDDRLSLTFRLLGRERKIAAKVIWTNRNGAGINFLPFNKRDTQIVDDLMFFVSHSQDEKRNVLDTIFSKVA